MRSSAAVAAALLLGMGVAAAALGVAPRSAIDPGLGTLTDQAGIRLAPAFGPDDEDCVIATTGASSYSAAVSHGQLICRQ